MGETITLFWTRHGFLPGVPARDLTQKDLDSRNLSKQELINSGCYVDADFFRESSKHNQDNEEE